MKKHKEKIERNDKGVTLVALTVTIIVLLILAGISIGVLTGENGLIKKANNAKEQSEIADEKEVVELAVTRAMRKDRYGNINKDNLDKELSKNIGTKNYNSKEVEEGIAVTFTKSKRSYLVDIEGNVTQYILKEPVPTPEDSELATLETMLYGVIEVEFLGEKGYEIAEANEPILKDGMEALYWAKDANGEIDLNNPANNTYEIPSEDTNFKKEKWYKYEAQEEDIDRKNKQMGKCNNK